MRLIKHPLFAGYVSCTLGILALLTVLCFHFPDILTSQEIRSLYTEQFARTTLLVGIAFAFFLGTLSILKDDTRRPALIGLTTSTLAVVLGGSTIEFGTIEKTPYSLGLDWFVLALFISALVFVPLEHYYAHKPLSPLRPGWRTDIAYFFMSHVLVQFILITATASTTYIDGAITIHGLKEWIQSVPIPLQFIMAVFFADLLQAVTHRAYHRGRFLWRMHSVHHSSPEMDWLAGSRVHFIETLLTRSAVLLPLVLCGFSQEALNAYAILVGIQAVVAHANIGINFGWLEYVVTLPRYHHWHHAQHKDYWDKNYAIHLPVIDMIMGTFKLPRDGSWPEAYGVLKPKQVPNGYIQQHLMPFRGFQDYDDYVRPQD